MADGLVIDLFAGGGGASVGIEAALGRCVDIAINHDATALAVHRANHPATRHLEADIWEVRPLEATGGGTVALLWASPDCRHFSLAKGDVPRSKGIRSLAWVVCRWAAEVRPSVIVVENVQEFRGWGPLGSDGRPDKARMGETFRRWRRRLERLGYVVDVRVLDASEYGAPTKRKRLFIIARCDGLPIEWPTPTHGPGRLPLRTAAECVDWSLPCPSIFERKRPLAEKTLWRVAKGIRRFVLEAPSPFIVKVNHGRREARVEPIDDPVAAFLAKHYGDPLRASGGGAVIGDDLVRPIGTVTARDHHSLAAVCLAKFRGSEKHGHPGCASVSEPISTIAAQGNHIAEVRAFLTAYYGSDSPSGQTKRCRGLVTVAGVDYQIIDIGLRMLEPHELLRAQFGRFAGEYDLSAATTKKAKVRLIGNSVCPEVAEAIVAANCGLADQRGAA